MTNTHNRLKQPLVMPKESWGTCRRQACFYVGVPVLEGEDDSNLEETINKLFIVIVDMPRHDVKDIFKGF